MDAAKEWPSILLFGNGDTITEPLIESRWRSLAKKYHPDTGGSNEEMTQLNLAKQFALKWVEKEQQRIAHIQKVTEQQGQILAQAQQMNRAMSQQMAAMQSNWASQANSLGGLGSMGVSNTANTPTNETPASKWRRFWHGR